MAGWQELRIVSGGQTGVDRAALDVALERKIPCGGWCPLGRRAEDGTIPDRYPVRETDTPDYAQRTEWNVRDSDGTLVLTAGAPTGGTALTVQFAQQYAKPLMIVDFDKPAAARGVVAWLREHRIAVLNVAGPRSSTQPGIEDHTREFLREVLRSIRRSSPKNKNIECRDSNDEGVTKPE